ncbi:type II secretion system GspH family protein [Lederbergia citrea]|uniref:Type II secretion system protein n=1 Tax=Lederbergia citrea TaxID=2833581 RepID=A0A942Z2D9_9BACI|nr:type II secretion system GspH family protein [Lederbergia citrea]MBS4176354.1 type II secretion system protein [Lederbergia citrea]MBS4202915.1 type II secretion system protein [Lederbergia citrea]MBS4222418.1 type II secretion system protein [Lederbergia citrea]
MYRNESGFTFLEGLIALGLMFLLCASLFPLMIHMLSNLQEGKKELVAFRLLYEHVEQQKPIEEKTSENRISRNIHYQLLMEKVGVEKWKACVTYEDQKKCIE